MKYCALFEAASAVLHAGAGSSYRYQVALGTAWLGSQSVVETSNLHRWQSFHLHQKYPAEIRKVNLV